MKILFLSDAGSYHTQRWVNYFVEQQYRCFLISLEKGFPTKAEEFLIPAKPLPNFLRYPLSLPRIKRLVKGIDPDLVNAHFVPNYGLIGALLGARPLVISTWGSDVLISPGKSWLHKLRAEYVLKRADLVTTDASVSARAVWQLGVPKEKVITYPMGVKRNLTGRQDKKEKPYLLVTSNRKLEPIYDLATLVRAIPLVIQQTRRDARFVIIGDGSQRNHLLNLAVKLKVESHLEFKGIVPPEELMEYYRDSDIYVSTSLSDSTSVSLLEAMNFGLIPIVTDIPGNKEWIEDGKNGFLFPQSDHKALAERIVLAISEPARWPDFRERNQAIIKGRAIWEDNMKAIEAEFLRIPAGDSGRGGSAANPGWDAGQKMTG
jgi:glycosyltransferase involved in cell wall biosynthesis